MGAASHRSYPSRLHGEQQRGNATPSMRRRSRPGARTTARPAFGSSTILTIRNDCNRPRRADIEAVCRRRRAGGVFVMRAACFDPHRRSLKPSRRGEVIMAAVQETVDRVRSIDVDAYKYGFVTDIESGHGAQGPERGHRPLHLGQEGRAGMDARMAAGGLSPLADDGRADLGARRLSRRSTTRTSTTTPRRKRRPGRSRSTRSIPSCCAPTRSSAFRWTSRRSSPASSGRASRWTRCSTPSRSPPPSRRSSPRRA